MRLRLAAAILAILLAACFAWGPLIGWSPWKPGFVHLALQRADVYYPTGSTLRPAYRELDRYILAGEEYLKLRAHRRITVIVTRDWDQFRRFLPHLRGTGVGAVTLLTGTVIYASPKLDERGLDHGEFLRHELAHALVHQQQSLWAAFHFGRIQWLSEGLSVSFGDQKAYLTPGEFRRRAPSEDVAAVMDPDSGKPLTDMKFAYVAWRQFVEYLMREKGRHRFQQFLEAAMAQPREWRERFQDAFGVSFPQAVSAFRSSIREATE